METIRYDRIYIDDQSRGVLILSDCSNYDSGNEISLEGLALKMINMSNNWFIDGKEAFDWVNLLYSLIIILKEKRHDIFIHIKSREYYYDFLRGVSTTDMILDMCDIFTDKSGMEYRLVG